MRLSNIETLIAIHAVRRYESICESERESLLKKLEHRLAKGLTADHIMELIGRDNLSDFLSESDVWELLDTSSVTVEVGHNVDSDDVRCVERSKRVTISLEFEEAE